MATLSTIKNQVKLPLAVAMEVVWQGIQIRLGRSIVTIMGVVLGIAFLMSIMTGQLAKQGVAHETQVRTEVARMMNFIEAETGPLNDRIIAVVQKGPLSEAENRFIQAILGRKPKTVRWVAMNGPAPTAIAGSGVVQTSTLDAAGPDATAILLVGEGPSPMIDWTTLTASARQKVVGLTRAADESIALPSTVVRTTLERKLRQEEIESIERDKQRASFRNIWIIVISLAVTVIGISNSMLMSVTERFREIGTMKCLGALSSFIRTLFLIESSLIGIAGGIVGTIVGTLFSLMLYGATYGFGLVLGPLPWARLFLYMLICLVTAIALSVLAALYPASFAARMVPATALRTNI